MSNLNEVLEFIKNSEKSELKSIYDAYAIRMSELKNDIKNTFRVGDIVSIDHKKIDPNQNFRIIKINIIYFLGQATYGINRRDFR